MEKKPEMIRRNRLVKWVRARSEVYEMMSKAKHDPVYMEGFAFALNKLCDDFDITPDELQQRRLDDGLTDEDRAVLRVEAETVRNLVSRNYQRK